MLKKIDHTRAIRAENKNKPFKNLLPLRVLGSLLLALVISGCNDKSDSPTPSNSVMPTMASSDPSQGVVIRSEAVEEELDILAVTPPVLPPEESLDEVQTSPPARIQLRWERPTLRADGSPLPVQEIGGFEIVAVNLDTDETTVHTLPQRRIQVATLPPLEPANYTIYLFVYDIDDNLSEPAEIRLSDSDFFLNT